MQGVYDESIDSFSSSDEDVDTGISDELHSDSEVGGRGEKRVFVDESVSTEKRPKTKATGSEVDKGEKVSTGTEKTWPSGLTRKIIVMGGCATNYISIVDLSVGDDEGQEAKNGDRVCVKYSMRPEGATQQMDGGRLSFILGSGEASFELACALTTVSELSAHITGY